VETELAAAKRAFAHMPHPHLARRAAAGPVKTADQLPTGSAVARFNTRVALLVTRVVGSMWCAYLFAALDLFSLPTAIRAGTATIVTWVAQTFLQLVLLSVIMVGQNVASAAADARAKATFDDGEALLQLADGHGKGLAQLHAKLDTGLARIHTRLDQELAAASARTKSSAPAAPDTPIVPPAPVSAVAAPPVPPAAADPTPPSTPPASTPPAVPPSAPPAPSSPADGAAGTGSTS